MSFDTLNQCSNDPYFRSRVQSCVVEQAYSPAMDDNLFALRVREAPEAMWQQFVWPCSLNAQADYASGVSTGLARPDLNVSDGEILSAVQANWPVNPAPDPTLGEGTT